MKKKKRLCLLRDDLRSGDTVAAEAINVIRATFIGATTSSITARRVAVNAAVVKISEHYLQGGEGVGGATPQSTFPKTSRRLYKQAAARRRRL